MKKRKDWAKLNQPKKKNWRKIAKVSNHSQLISTNHMLIEEIAFSHHLELIILKPAQLMIRYIWQTEKQRVFHIHNQDSIAIHMVLLLKKSTFFHNAKVKKHHHAKRIFSRLTFISHTLTQVTAWIHLLHQILRHAQLMIRNIWLMEELRLSHIQRMVTTVIHLVFIVNGLQRMTLLNYNNKCQILLFKTDHGDHKFYMFIMKFILALSPKVLQQLPKTLDTFHTTTLDFQVSTSTHWNTAQISTREWLSSMEGPKPLLIQQRVSTAMPILV